MNSLDDRGITGYYTAIFKVTMKREKGTYVEVYLEWEDGPALLKLCDQVVEAGGLQAIGQLYLDRGNIGDEGLRCDHKMEADEVKPFPAEGIDGKPIYDPEVVWLLLVQVSRGSAVGAGEISSGPGEEAGGEFPSASFNRISMYRFAIYAYANLLMLGVLSNRLTKCCQPSAS